MFGRYLLFIFTFCIPAVAVADEIYTWTDADGKVHFSTTPQKANAEKADLPSIRREDIDERIATIKDATPPNCHAHGGVDCSRGADTDGSVVCLNGFRDALLPYKFSCLEARLTSSDFSILGPTSEVITSLEEKKEGFSDDIQLSGEENVFLTLRNNSSVEAFGVSVSFRVGGGGDIIAIGPEKIGPFGVAEYQRPLRELPADVTARGLRRLDYKVRCTNCRSISRTGR